MAYKSAYPPPLFTTLLVIYTYSDVGKLFYNRSLFFITIPQSWAVSIGHWNWFLVEGVEVRSLSLFKCGHWACRSVRYLLYSKLLAIVAYIGVVRSPTSTKTSTSLLARFCKACVALAKFSYSTLFASQHPSEICSLISQGKHRLQIGASVINPWYNGY